MERIDENGNQLFSDFYEKEFIEEFTKNGFVILDNVLDKGFIKTATKELEKAIEKEVEYMGTTDYKFYGYVLSNARYGGVFWQMLDMDRVIKPIDLIMGNNSILYSYTSSSMPPFSGNDASHIHVDNPLFLKDMILRMGVLLPLVDFTKDNGASYFLKGSHLSEYMPEKDQFYSQATRLTIKAGQAVFFNTRVWHAGGVNKTKEWRHALTMNICKPWMKQYIDIPRLLFDKDVSKLSERVMQKLGYFSQSPASYDEYFDNSRKRKF